MASLALVQRTPKDNANIPKKTQKEVKPRRRPILADTPTRYHHKQPATIHDNACASKQMSSRTAIPCRAGAVQARAWGEIVLTRGEKKRKKRLTRHALVASRATHTLEFQPASGCASAEPASTAALWPYLWPIRPRDASRPEPEKLD